MLIRNAEIFSIDPGTRRCADIRLEDGRIAGIGRLSAGPGEVVYDAASCAVLPGLHDHHLHFLSYAAALDSVRCGPPEVTSEDALREALCRADGGEGWLRGYGYHESVAGEIDRQRLDRWLPDRPVRVQHRSGRLWIFNSRGLEALRANGAAPALIAADGRIYDQDQALGRLLGRVLPPVARASQQLAAWGVTGFTDMTPSNDPERLTLLAGLQREGQLLQRVHLAGAPSLPFPEAIERVTVGATKIHLHESALPAFDDLCQVITRSHARNQPVAVHCVTDAELIFALAALRAGGHHPRDRIEHASVTPPELIEQLEASGVTVVTQPNFILERGDVYLEEVPAAQHPWLYRVRSLLDRGIPLAAGTDAPFGGADPWHAIGAAVSRRTSGDRIIGPEEALSPERALALFLGSAERPERPRQLEAGAAADLCILDAPWASVRQSLSSGRVAASVRAGKLIFDRVD